MKIPIDECSTGALFVTCRATRSKTVRQMGWTETVNGALLALAEQDFDVLVTTARREER